MSTHDILYWRSVFDHRTCTTCPDDEAHHFLIDSDEIFPEGRLVCRHCPVTRPLHPDDIDRYA